MLGSLLTASPIRSSNRVEGGTEGMSTQAGRARPEEVGPPVDDTQGQSLPLLLQLPLRLSPPSNSEVGALPQLPHRSHAC